MMKRKLKALLFRFLVAVLGLYAWRYFLMNQNYDASVELYLKQRLDLAITKRTRQLLGKHLIEFNITTSRETRQKIRRIQARFICYTCHGSWLIKGPNMSQYHHDEKCIEGWRSLEKLDLKDLVELFCNRLYGNRILIVGPLAFYHAQVLLLEALAKHDRKSYPERSPESNSHYLVCTKSQEEKQSQQNPPQNLRQAPKYSFNTTRISFSLSDTLRPIHGPEDNEPNVDPKTGVRVQNSNWLSESEKAQILILNKGPMPAPAWTFDGGAGNWSFAQKKNGSPEETLNESIVNAALSAVFQVYVPELFRTLNAIGEGAHSYKIFVGSWYQQPTCTNFGLDASFRTTKLIWEPHYEVDPWSLYYNTQVYITDRVLPVILPYFNVTFIPMTMTLVPESHSFRVLEPMARRKDCLRPVSIHPVGETIQMAFIKTLLYQLR